MAPAGYAAVALWLAGAAPQVEMDARIETRTRASGTVARTPFDQVPVLDATPSVALKATFPRTRLLAAYEPYLVLANAGRRNDSSVLHRLTLSAERALSLNWTGRLRAAGAAGTTIPTRTILNEPSLEVAPSARVLRIAQTEVSSLVAGRPAPRMTVTTDAALFWGGGLDARSKVDAPPLREARLATVLTWEATRRDRLTVEATALGADVVNGRRSAVATTMGGLSRRLTPNADAWASAGLGLQWTETPTPLSPFAPREANSFRIGPAASAGTALHLQDDRLQLQALVRAAPRLSIWDGTPAWYIDVGTTVRAVLNRRWGAFAGVSGLRTVSAGGLETDVGELDARVNYSPVARVAVSAGLWTRRQSGASGLIVETGALVACSVTGIPLGGDVPVASPR